MAYSLESNSTDPSGQQYRARYRAQGNGSWPEKLVFTVAGASVIGMGFLLPLNPLHWVLGFMAAVFCVDLLSAMVHWYFDNHVKPGPKGMGRIAVDFLDHHLEPERTVDVGFVKSALRPALFVSLPFAVLAFFTELGFASIFIWWVGFLSMFVPQLHKLAHLKNGNPMLKLLQEKSLILNPQKHKQHHRPPFDTSYCVFTGWLNGFLNSIGFWKKMDKIVLFFRLQV